MSWLVVRGYKEDFVRKQIVRASSLDRERLFNQEGRCNDKRKDQVPLVVTFRPALNELRGIIKKLYTMLEASEEHWMAFKEQPFVVFRRAPNLKDNLVRAKLPMIRTEGVKGCFRCGKALCQVCSYTSEGSSFRCIVSGKEYDINSDFNCDSSGVVGQKRENITSGTVVETLGHIHRTTKVIDIYCSSRVILVQNYRL